MENDHFASYTEQTTYLWHQKLGSVQWGPHHKPLQKQSLHWMWSALKRELLVRNFTGTTTTWLWDPFIGLFPTAVKWSFCNPNDCVGLQGGLTKGFCEMHCEFLQVSPQGQEEAGSLFFPRSLFLIKSIYHKSINWKGNKKSDELLLFPAFYFGCIFLGIMALGQYARHVWLNLYGFIFTLSRIIHLASRDLTQITYIKSQQNYIGISEPKFLFKKIYSSIPKPSLNPKEQDQNKS